MKKPLITVITPTYNHAVYIGRCIESLLSQTYSNWEMIIVDDGSTDDTAKVVKRYSDSRITYLAEAHRGVTALATTLNIGLKRAKGKLVTAFMSDDTWPAYRLERQAPLFEDSRVVMCLGWQYLIDPSDAIIGKYPVPRFVKPIMNRPVGSVLGTLLLSNWIPEPTVLISKAALDRIGGYLQPEGQLAEDYPTHLALALQGEFRYLDMPLANYRMHPQQMTKKHILEMDRLDAAMSMEFFRGLGPELRQLTGLTEIVLARNTVEMLNNSYFREGRRRLLKGDWIGARSQFFTALRRGGPYTKVKALGGIFCSVLGTDAEWLARLSRRPPLR